MDVRNAAVVSEPLAAEPRSRQPLVLVLLAIGVAVWLTRKPVAKLLASRQRRRSDPSTAAARRLLAACRTNAAGEAYAALLQWKRAEGLGTASLQERLPSDAAAEFEHQWNELSRHVFGVGSSGAAWRGQRLAEVFVQVRRKLGQVPHTRVADVDLPALNPISSSDG